MDPNLNNYNYYNNYNNNYPPAAPPEEKGMSIASMVLGICGFLAWCLPIFGYPVSIVGLVLGILGIKKGGKGMATAGIIMCSITLALTLGNSILGVFLSTMGFLF